MRCPLALYRNRGSSPIYLRIGELPGEPPYIYAANPGGAVEGPASYDRQFAAAGFFLEKHLGDGELKAPQDWPGRPKFELPSAADSEQAAAPDQEPEQAEQADPSPGVVIGAQPQSPIEEPTPAKPSTKKRGG